MREIKPPRIAILDCNNSPLAFMDCSSHGSLDYWNDELHEYLEGTSTTLTLTSSARHSDSLYLVEGNKLAFEYNGKDYYLNIMKTVRTELTVEIEAWSVNLELLNEVKLAYDSPNAQTFEQYLNRFDPEHTVKLGLNEVSDKKLKLKWTGEDTILARLYSLANNFDAEIEFLPELNDDYSLKQIVINVYRKHDENHQGIGKANSLNLRYGSDIDGVTKTTDITDLYTCIRPYGKTDSKTNKKLDLSGLKKTEYDKDGNVEYFVEGSLIRAPQARDRFPSNLVTGDRYIVQNWNCDTDNKEMLYGRALAELKKNCTPRVTYEIDGFADTGIGDTVRITDEEYNPVLYIDARVTEQIRSFTDPLRNKTTFSNVEVLQNQVSDSLLQSVQELIAQNKTYIGQISTTNGVQFVNGTGSTTLTAIVLDGVIEVTDNYTINWKKDGQTIGTGKSITINATDFTGKAVISFEATNTEGVVISKSEATLTSVRDGVDGQNGRDGQNGKDGLNGKDGEKGEQGIPGPKGEDGKDGANGKDGKTTYFHIKYSPVQNPTSAQLTETPSTYIGTYVDFVSSDSTDPSKYTWSRFEGLKGDQGIPGTNGTNGKTSYLHIAYATNATGTSGFSVSDSAGKTYIGQYTDFVQNDSTNPSKYSWTLIKGDKGDTGQKGADGKNGKDGINGTNGKDGKDGLNGLNGIDALSIEISQSWSGDEVTLTASVFRGGTKLTDDQILALGQIRWFKGGTRLGNGKSIKRTLTGRETIECRLDNGASVSKLALLDNGELVSTNRNLLKNADFANRGTDSRYNAELNPGQMFAGGWGGYNGDAKYPDGHHAHLEQINGEWVYVFEETGGQWLGISMPIYNLQDKNTSSPLIPNSKMTISCQVYRVSGNNRPSGGLYHRVKGGTGNGFNSGGNSMFEGEVKTGAWTTVSHTITVNKDFDPAYETRLYIYGDYGGNGKFYVKNPMLTYGDTVEPFTTRIEDQNGTDKTVTLAYKSLTIEMDLQPIITEGLTNAQGERVELENRLLKQVEESVGSVSQTIKDEVYAKSDVDRMLSSVSTTLKQDKESVQILFNQLSAQMSESGQATDAQFDEISKYIRFIDGNVEIGNSTSPIQLQVMNDRISFRQAGEEVAWFSNNTLFVTDGNFVKSLRVGKFAFVPRANGSLDFKKVGD